MLNYGCSVGTLHHIEHAILVSRSCVRDNWFNVLRLPCSVVGMCLYIYFALYHVRRQCFVVNWSSCWRSMFYISLQALGLFSECFFKVEHLIHALWFCGLCLNLALYYGFLSYNVLVPVLGAFSLSSLPSTSSSFSFLLLRSCSYICLPTRWSVKYSNHHQSEKCFLIVLASQKPPA